MLRSGLSCLHANDNNFVHQAMVVLKAQAAGMIKNESAEIKPLLCSPITVIISALHSEELPTNLIKGEPIEQHPTEMTSYFSLSDFGFF